MKGRFFTVILAGLGIAADAAVVRAVAIPATLPECGRLMNGPVLAVDVGAVGGMAGLAELGADVASAGSVSGVARIGGEVSVLGAMGECRRVEAEGLAVFGVLGMAAGVAMENGSPVLPLRGTLPVDFGVPVMRGLGGVVDVEAFGLPFVGAMAPVVGAEGLVSVVSGVESARPVDDNGMPQFGCLKVVAGTELDPFLGLVDIWQYGPLGELKRAAKRAAEAGDEVEHRRLVGVYWQAMGAAMGRRDAKQKRVEVERPTRGSGSFEKGGQRP